MRDLEAFGLILTEGESQSSVRERKRVREALLSNFSPFTNALLSLKSKLQCYVDFADNLLVKKFERDWSVKLFIAPEFMADSISDEAYYLCDMIPLFSKAELAEYGDFKNEPPKLIFKDSIYKYPKIWHGTPQDNQYSVYVSLPANITNNEVQAVLKHVDIGKRTTNLNDTSNVSLDEKINLLRCLNDRGMNISQATRHLNPKLDLDALANKRSRYSKLKRQMLEIIAPPAQV